MTRGGAIVNGCIGEEQDVEEGRGSVSGTRKAVAMVEQRRQRRWGEMDLDEMWLSPDLEGEVPYKHPETKGGLFVLGGNSTRD